MTPALLAAVVQMNSTERVGDNVALACELIGVAAQRGASLVVLPENVALMGPEEAKLGHAERFEPGMEPTGPIGRAAVAVSRERRVWTLWGGVPERPDGLEVGVRPERVFNSAVLVSPDGGFVARYRKIHLFDVDLADGTRLCESRTILAGDTLVVAETPIGGLGLSICYDLRFPELYRRLVDLGATTLAIPAAFTLTTGRDHWHVLLRARAIESQCHVLAAAQWGSHGPGRSTYGHAMIVDPWGTVLAECPDGEGVAVAEIDGLRRERIREGLPTLRHRRL